MRRKWVWLGAGIGVAVLAPVLVYGGLLVAAFEQAGRCEYQLVDQQVSPDQRYKAGVAEESCGATTGFARLVLLTEANKQFSHKHDMLAAVEGQQLNIRWDGPILNVEYPQSERLVIHRRVAEVRYQPTS